ncbi:ribokinase [Domibacillus epiphyticus]|uniref:Ribokinase n=1 Tax=Domibacillus epiphyticus TaxID=1714355 RepID=A0A1V2A6F9_9BACI|nr:ribokinase [Domibacillus epiphyticus]OMP66452.1 ribokinase [Domibacillus epiphyticus]
MGNVIVIGSYVVDLMSRAPRLPKPGETVLGGPFQIGPGGKGGNQATAAARSGSNVTFVTKIGRDLFGQDAVEHFKKEQFNTHFVQIADEEATGAALIAVDINGENQIVIAPGACGTMTKQNVLEADAAIKEGDIVVLQLEISMGAVEAAVERAVLHNVPVLLNPAPYQAFPREILKHVTYATPNETEASNLTGVEVKNEASAQKAADILHQLGVKTVMITLGHKGVFLSERAFSGRVLPGFNVEAVDTTGAGDAFNGGFAHAITSGQSLEEAVRFGQAAAALSVTKNGTADSMPYAGEIMAFLSER